MIGIYLQRLLDAGYTRFALDCTETPIMATVYTDAGPRHFPGKDVEDAFNRAQMALCKPEPIVVEEE